MKINPNFARLGKSYLFAEIDRRRKEYLTAHPQANVISLGIGDVTRPLCSAATKAFEQAAAEMGHAETFRGYGDYEGYLFLREAVSARYARKGVTVSPDEIWISDGAKSDLASLIRLFDKRNTVLICEPVYPVYVDTNLLDGRKIRLLAATAENGFLPRPPKYKADLIYLCSPNNPTGAVYSKQQLAEWVSYANRCNAVILFDAAYEAFITDPDLPHSIYEIDGARTCAIEICSFSKTAGFTGVRCGYTVIPKQLNRGGKSLGALWQRQLGATFNGVGYAVQRAAEAVCSPEGEAQCAETVELYRNNAKMIMEALGDHPYTGGTQAPYIWMKCPFGLDSWSWFDLLLHKAQVVGTPGVGFGQSGEGYFRLTAFGNPERVKEASLRLKAVLESR